MKVRASSWVDRFCFFGPSGIFVGRRSAFSYSASRYSYSKTPESFQVDPSEIQKFYVPNGATRLFLGTADGFGWFNNDGGFNTDITDYSQATVPGPSLSMRSTLSMLSAVNNVNNVNVVRCQHSQSCQHRQCRQKSRRRKAALQC